jgi:hypothetical protein
MNSSYARRATASRETGGVADAEGCVKVDAAARAGRLAARAARGVVVVSGEDFFGIMLDAEQDQDHLAARRPLCGTPGMGGKRAIELQRVVSGLPTK